MRLIDIDKAVPELNNLSLREVFEGGNLIAPFTSWSILANRGTFTIQDDVILAQGNGTHGTINIATSPQFTTTNQNIYSVYSFRLLTEIPMTMRVGSFDNPFIIDYIDATNLQLNTNIVSSGLMNTSTTTNFQYRIISNYSSTTQQNNASFIVNYFKSYNLTALGINLTKEQMDDYFAMYQSGVEASGFVQKTSANLESTNYIETTNGTFRSEFGDIVPVLSNQVINLKQNISGSHRFAIRFFDENMNQIQSGLTLPSYSGSTITYNSALQFWNNGSNLTSRNILVQINGNQGIHYVQMGVQTGNVAGVVSATDRLISQQIDTYQPYRPFALAKGIDEVAYGGKTYREIFEGGNVVSNNDFSDGLTTWVGNLYGSTNILSLVNGNLFITNAGNVSTMFAGKNPMLTTTVGHKYYLNAKMRVVNRNASSLELGNGSWGYIVQSNPFQNQWYEMSDIRTAVATTHDFLLLSRYPTGQQTTPIQEVDGSHGTYAINLTQLFGAGNEPDKATMDKLFQQYQEGGTVQAQAFIQTAGKDTRVIDAKLPYLNMMSIREVFESNLVVNGDFSDGTTAWVPLSGTTITNDNGELLVNVSSNFRKLYNSTNLGLKTNDTIYFSYQSYAPSNQLLIPYFRVGESTSDPIISYGFVGGNLTTTKQTFSTKTVIPSNANYLWFEPASAISYYLDNIHLINLTALNLTHLTQAELDAMFALYQAGTLKLSDVFETGNLVTNGDFSNGTTGWTSIGTTSFSVSNKIASFLASGVNGRIQQIVTPTSQNGLTYYTSASIKSSSNLLAFDPLTSLFRVYHSGSNFFERISIKFVAPDTAGFGVRILDDRTSGFDIVQVQDVYYINLNTHNLQATTKTFMDDLFKAYQRYSSALFIDKDGIAYGVVFVSKGD